MRVLSSSEDSGSETEDCNTDVWNDKPRNFFTIATHKHRKTGTEALIASNILSSPKLVAMATQMKIMPAEQFAFTSAFIEQTGEDPAKVKLSYACFCAAGFQIVSLLTLQGHRNPTIRLSAKTVEDILSKFIQNNSKIQYCQFKRSNAIPTSAYKFRHTKLANRFKSPENLS